MAVTPKSGISIIGAIFLLVGVLKFFTGGGWIVWIILGLLFGGLGVFVRRGSAN